MYYHKCEYCGKELEVDVYQKIGGHLTNCSKNPSKIDRVIINSKKKKEYTLNCIKCNKKYILEMTEYIFNKGDYRKCCSSFCSHSREHSIESKIKTSNTLKNKFPKKEKIKNKPIKTKKSFIEDFDKKIIKEKKSKPIFERKIKNEEGITFIYTLSDPDTKEIRYIGKTNNPKERIRKHLRESKLKRTHKEKWIYSLLENNKKPIFEILEIVERKNWCDEEIFWINQFKYWGFNLLNSTMGGEGSDGFRGKKHSEETKEICRLKALNKNKNKIKKGEDIPSSKLKWNDIINIRKMFNENISIKIIYELYKDRTSKNNLYKIKNNKIWKIDFFLFYSFFFNIFFK